MLSEKCPTFLVKIKFAAIKAWLTGDNDSEKKQGNQTSKIFCFERMLLFKVKGIKQDMCWCVEEE